MSNEIQQQGMSNAEWFQMLYTRYYRLLYYWAYSITRDRELAQDAVQETFLKAYRHIGSLKRQDRLIAWLIAICRHVAIDMYRKRRRELCYQSLEDACGGEASVERTVVEQDYLRELLSSLKPISREALLLIYVYGLTYEQLADCQRISVSAVKSRIHRAKQKVRGAALQMDSNVGINPVWTDPMSVRI
ncbi:RNA polymerase sigma factor [Paenibacillus sp. 1P07SE]|uniref:RNA polymerase sigma factor n=1 Tax=Paenibacillus sp. 1P07SE TaxID=3132209 RepID=UPI0039A486C9